PLAVADLVRKRHAAVADLHQARLAPHAQHVDEVAVLLRRAAAEEGGRVERGGELLGQRLPLLLRHAGAEASGVVRIAPATARVQPLHRALDLAEHHTLAMIATGLAGAVAAAAHPSVIAPGPRRRKVGEIRPGGAPDVG